ncbi:hypothetical protein [Kiloniella laminariae]|uniref:hypothetical protein n=1 Tax=Kiloniella laminariae TaxID=454162 RepID=UPI00036EAE61|nr:hypothetical protein [Kiloniella laminariae]
MIIRAALVGLGSVNRHLMTILADKKDRLQQDHEVEIRLVALVDSRGVAASQDEQGYDPREILAAKQAGKSTADLPGYQPGRSMVELIETLDCDLVFEASPVDLVTGGPGLEVTRKALARGITVVLANKGPLVLAYHELHELAARSGAGLGFSATVCGGLPIINMGRRDMIAGDISRLRGIFNSTSNFILGEMATGRSYDDALAEAQRRGIAETDPSLDVGGWDTANKLVIIANAILRMKVGLKDVAVAGITDITPAMITAAANEGKVYKLVASAEGGKLSVAPLALPKDDFLAHCDGWEMGVEIHSDIYGIMYHKLWEREPTPTAASMLRDAVNIICG